MSLRVFRTTRAPLTVGLLALGTALMTTTACSERLGGGGVADSLQTALSAAERARDSLAAIVSGADAGRDRAMADVLEASKFADAVDAELRQVRGLRARVQPQAADETGAAQAAAARRDILDRLQQLRQRLAERQSQLEAARRRLTGMQADSSAAAQLLADLQARLTLRDQEIEAFQSEITSLRAANVQLTEEKAALTDTVRDVQTRANRVYWAIGTKRALLDRGLVREEGGTRALLVTRLGETLVPARDLDPALFVPGDRRTSTTIALPRSDKWYRIVSRHDVAFIEAAEKDDKGNFRGTEIRITDPNAFWRASPFLIVVEQ